MYHGMYIFSGNLPDCYTYPKYEHHKTAHSVIAFGMP